MKRIRKEVAKYIPITALILMVYLIGFVNGLSPDQSHKVIRLLSSLVSPTRPDVQIQHAVIFAARTGARVKSVRASWNDIILVTTDEAEFAVGRDGKVALQTKLQARSF